MADPLPVEYPTVTADVAGDERLTVNANGTVEASSRLASWMEIVGAIATSSLITVAVPVVVPGAAFTKLARLTLKVSSASITVSPLTLTVTDSDVSPGKKLTGAPTSAV